jgi:hypothetical protein
MLHDMTRAEALEKADALKSLNQIDVYLCDASDFPWSNVTDVEGGGSYRFSGPCGLYLIAEENGLRFKLNFDFEGRDANGRRVSLFDRDRLRDLVLKLPLAIRPKLAKFMREKVLPDLEKRTAEVRDVMNKQWDSEDCVRGIIALAAQPVT